MQRLLKGIPFVLACLLAYFIFRAVGEDPQHITAQTLKLIKAKHPNSEVAVVTGGNMLQYEAYGKPAKRQFRVQALKPGKVEFYDAEGKSVMKMYVEQGDVLITVPLHKNIEAYDFEPFEWLE